MFSSSVAPEAIPAVVQSTLQGIVLDVMALCWLAAIVVAVWGAITEAGRVERARRRELATESEPGPTPGIDGLLERWGLWAILLSAAGVALLAWASTMGRL